MWKPTEEQINNSQMMAYIQFVNQKFQLSLKNYSQLYDWSIERVEDFWGSFWESLRIILLTFLMSGSSLEHEPEI